MHSRHNDGSRATSRLGWPRLNEFVRQARARGIDPWDLRLEIDLALPRTVVASWRRLRL